MTYSSEKQKFVRKTKKQNLAILRLLIDIVEENPDMTFAAVVHALNLNKIRSDQDGDEVLVLMKKWCHTLKLLRSIHD